MQKGQNDRVSKRAIQEKGERERDRESAHAEVRILFKELNFK